MNYRCLRNMLIVCLSILYFTGCPAGKETVKTEPPFPQREYDETVLRGDAYFNKMHLHGWRKADEFYSKAYEIKKSPQLRDKRFLTLCLTAMREKDEQIVNPRTYEKIDGLGDFQRDPRQRYFFDMIQHYRSAPVVRDGDPRLRCAEKKEVDITLFDIENSALDAYLYLYFLNYYSYDFEAYSEQLVELFKKHKLLMVTETHTASLSPLFIYSNFQKVKDRVEEIEAKYPEFAEILVLTGNILFKQNKLKKAAVYLHKALELVPDYPAALNGIGNIYYFTVKNYEQAILYYDKTLASDPLNPVALFGKGVSLHFLKRYEESDAVFDFLLAGQPRHHGETYYYKAYNRHMQDEPDNARPLIDKAKALLPDSGEVHFLSGLLYFNAGKTAEAEADLLKAVWDPQYSDCYPLYYLGMLKLKVKNWEFLREFTDSIRCLEARERQMEDRVNTVEKMDLGDADKEWVKRDRRAALDSFRETSGKMVEQMRLIIDRNKGKKEANDTREKNEALRRVKAALEMDPGLLNSKDSEGATLLHRAIDRDRTAAAEYLVGRGARLDIKNAEGYTPLHWAVLLGRTEIVKVLIRAGADVTVTVTDNMTPLHDAAYAGHEEIVRLLLAAGADPYARNDQGKAPISMAAAQGKATLYKMLKPLHTAVEEGNTAAVKGFLEKRPGLINEKDEKGRTPLYVAAAAGHEDMAWLLVNSGADLNARDRGGYTALMRAKALGFDGIARLLLAKGADIPDDELLKRPMEEKRAVVWYLSDISWVVKTGSRFLVFDYDPMSMRGGYVVPDEQMLSNGHLNPSQIRDQDVYVFVTNNLVNERNPNLILEWKKVVPRITYIFGWDALTGARYINMKPGEEKTINGMEIITVDATGEGVAYLVKTDGLTILYAGSHGSWDEAGWGDFTRGIDSLARRVSSVDIVFLYLPGEYSDRRECVNRGNFYILEKLGAKMMFPLYTGVGKMPIGAFIEEAVRRGIKTVIRAPESRGDRFLY